MHIWASVSLGCDAVMVKMVTTAATPTPERPLLHDDRHSDKRVITIVQRNLLKPTITAAKWPKWDVVVQGRSARTSHVLCSRIDTDVPEVRDVRKQSTVKSQWTGQAGGRRIKN